MATRSSSSKQTLAQVDGAVEAAMPTLVSEANLLLEAPTPGEEIRWPLELETHGVEEG